MVDRIEHLYQQRLAGRAIEAQQLSPLQWVMWLEWNGEMEWQERQLRIVTAWKRF